jgi:hypothetical protein
MKKLLLSLFVLFACIPMQAQQSIESHNVAAYNAVSLTGNLNVELISSDKNAIDIELIGAEINRLKWGVSKETLTVTLKPGGTKATANVKIYYATAPTDISISGGELHTDEHLTGTFAKITVDAGAKVTASFDVKELEVKVQGNSVAQFDGTVKYITVNVYEKSKADMRELEGVSVTASASAGAEIYVWASERLIANAKTGATIFYKGSPEILRDISPKLNMGLGSSVLNIGK